MKARRKESSRKLACGRAAAWLLVPLIVLTVLVPRVTLLRPMIWMRYTFKTVAEPQATPAMPRHTLGPASYTDDVAAPRSKLSCNFSNWRMDICVMEGDIRMHGKSAILCVVEASDDSYRPPENGTLTVRPYPRKGEISTMQKIRGVTIRPVATTDSTAPPQCTVTHDVPAVIFSTGGFSNNAFHVMADIFIPLYNTAREYDGRVQLVATDYDRQWVSKYRHLLAALSIYPVIDFDADDAVRCFPLAHVGIDSHKDLGIIPALSRNGYTMMDFQSFLRSAYSLKRAWATPVNRRSGERPRLIMIPRGESRVLTNEADVIVAATEVGFEVVTVELEVVSDMARFTEVVNRCDVLLGVHGAGLTNFVFLPRGATVVQIIPWGELKWMSWSDYRDPLPDMGLRYAEYEATAEETTLKDAYPRDHAVFTDPLSIHKKGFDMVWSIFLGQNVTLDIKRFTGLMQQVYQSIIIT